MLTRGPSEVSGSGTARIYGRPAAAASASRPVVKAMRLGYGDTLLRVPALRGAAASAGRQHHMKIHPARLIEADDTVTVRYAFETVAKTDLPSELWFRLPRAWKSWIQRGPEPAVAALAFMALALGEDIEVEEFVSPRFRYGFERAVEHFRLWWSELRPVELRAPGLNPMTPSGATAVMSCFSGGVDSFHTLYAHLGAAAAHPSFRLTHLFFAHGFDIPLDNPVYTTIAGEFDQLAATLGLRLVRLATNAREMLDPYLRWDQTHGACIAASGLLLSGGVRRFIIPSTNRQSLLFVPCGSNPVTDPMFGTESLEIIHHGTHLSRIEKILALADRSEAQTSVRVCWQNVPGERNCGRCVKCLKTMMPLAIVGRLNQFSAFPPLPPWNAIDRDCFAALDVSALAPEQSYADELGALAAAHRFKEFPRWRLAEQSLRRRAKAMLRGLGRVFPSLER